MEAECGLEELYGTPSTVVPQTLPTEPQAWQRLVKMEYGAWVGLWTFIGMFALLLLGVPIWISLAAAAFAGSWLIGGQAYTFQQFSSAPYYITATFNFAVVPLFILMSVLAPRSRCTCSPSALVTNIEPKPGIRLSQALKTT